MFQFLHSLMQNLCTNYAQDTPIYCV